MSIDENNLLTGRPHDFLVNLEVARKYRSSVVLLRGDYGGQVMAIFPVAMVLGAETTLNALLHELGSLEWWEDDGLSLDYVIAPTGTVIPGGMGGGVARAQVWVHDDFAEEVGHEMKPMVEMVLSGQAKTLSEVLVPKLVVDLDVPTRATRAIKAIAALGTVGEATTSAVSQAVPRLLQAAESSTLRYTALTYFAYMPYAATQTLPILLQAMGSPSESDREAAETAISRLGNAAKGCIPQLESLTLNQNPAVQASAIRTLLSLEVPGEQFVPRLLNNLKSLDVRTRLYAMDLLGSIGIAAADAVAAIEPFVSSPARRTRLTAIRAIAAIQSAIDAAKGPTSE